MKYCLCLLLFMVVLSSSGCLWFGKKGPEPANDGVSIQVIEDSLWTSGGALVMIPFTPGTDAEAGPKVDRIALSIVKGFSDAFSSNPDKQARFRLLTGEDVGRARYVIAGRIEEYDTGSHWRSIGIGKKDISLKIKGELRDRETGQVVALIFAYRSFRNAQDTDAVAYTLGNALGQKVGY